MRYVTSLFAALLLLACDAGGNNPANAQNTAADFPSATPFTLQTADGGTFNYPQDSNGVHVLLFWATWCPYCKQLMPHLQSLKDELGDQVTIYAINIRDDGDPAAYIEENGYDFELLLEGDEVAKQYDVKGTPGLVLVDSDGAMRFDLGSLLAPASKALEGLKHGQRSRRIAPWWAAQIRREIDSLL